MVFLLVTQDTLRQYIQQRLKPRVQPVSVLLLH
jgi:hypothetical protein